MCINMRFVIMRFISSVELGKVMADLGERLSEEEVSFIVIIFNHYQYHYLYHYHYLSY